MVNTPFGSKLKPVLEQTVPVGTKLYTAAPVAQQPLTRTQVQEVLSEAGYDGATPESRADFINGIRHAEAHRAAQQPQAEAVRPEMPDPYGPVAAYVARLEAELDDCKRAAPQQAEAVPPGYALVPVEPTDEMFFNPDDVCVNFTETPRDAFRRIYRALLAAAPQPKGDQT